MISKLPGSSDPTPAELARLQYQCDRVRAENQLHSLDHQDQEKAAELVLLIPSDENDRLATSRPLRFSDIRFVGRGAFGMVFSCDDATQGGKRVAVKVLRPSRQHDRIARERFQEELRVMSGLNHPGIVRVFGTGVIDNLPYMITEFADAGSVAAFLMDGSKRISPRQAAWLVSRIADSVEEAHSTPILHRDIKPGNILLRREVPESSEGLGLWPLLTDFGLSKSLGQQSANPLTFEGEVLGTLSYMSPEQVRGQSLKTQSDIFPLGIVLHELAYGQHPFLDESDFQTRHNIVQNPPSKPQKNLRRIPIALEAIISKCLQKNPEDRYQHASDLSRDLRRFLHGEPISVAPPSAWQSITAWVASHPIASTFIGTAFCFFLASVLLLSREWKIERELAQASKTLADDRAKISRLFLESMRATNSGINDTILSGQRVLPTALLQTLERQVPLLENALALAPDDDLLIRQLEIMYHYKSLCHVFAIRSTNDENDEFHFTEAVESRKKSLQYIDLLVARFPDEENLLISKINGEYFMSSLMQTRSDQQLWREWIAKGIASSEAFLRKHPDNALVLETANKIRLDWCSAIGQENPEEALRLLKEIGDSFLFLQMQYPTRTTLFTYAAQAITQRSLLLVKQERSWEAISAFEQIESQFNRHREALKDDWQAVDALFNSYAMACEALMNAKDFSETEQLARRWDALVKSLTFSNYTMIQGYRFRGNEFALLFPSYYRWLSLSETSSDGPECRQLGQELPQLLERCKNQSAEDFKVFVKKISTSHPSNNRLQSLLDRMSKDSNSKEAR